MAHVTVSGLAYAHPGGDLLFSDVSFRIVARPARRPRRANGVGQEHAAADPRRGAVSPTTVRPRWAAVSATWPRTSASATAAHRARALAVARAARRPRRRTARAHRRARARRRGSRRRHAGSARRSPTGRRSADTSSRGTGTRPAGGSFARRSTSSLTAPRVTLSGGERKQLVIDVLFASDADVLLLDEPDNFLDVPAKLALEQRIRDVEEDDADDLPRSRGPVAGAVGTILTLEGNGAWVHGGPYATYPAGARGSPAAAGRRRQALARGGAPPVRTDEDLQGAGPLLQRLGQEGRRRRDPLAPLQGRRAAAAAGARLARSPSRMRGGDSARRVLDLRRARHRRSRLRRSPRRSTSASASA